MREKLKVKGLFLLTLIFLFSFACAEQSVKQAASSLCELYNSDNWVNSQSNSGTQELYGRIIEQQEKRITNENVKTVLESADNSNYANYFYSVEAGMASLLGEPWGCVHFGNFYLPMQKVVSLNLTGVLSKRIDPQADNVVTIMLAADGAVLINNSPLVNSSKDAVQKALKDSFGESLKGMQIFVYFYQGANGGRAAELLAALAGIGIIEVELIYM